MCGSVRILVFILGFASVTNSSFFVVKSLNDTIYLINRNTTLKRISSTDTLKSLGYTIGSLQIVSDSFLDSFERGEDVPLIRQENGTPDEILRVELLKINTLQNSQLLVELYHLGENVNPSIIKWKDRLFLCTGFAWELKGRKGTDRIEFSWVNQSFLPYTSAEHYLGIENENCELPTSLVGKLLNCISTGVAVCPLFLPPYFNSHRARSTFAHTKRQ